MARTKEGAQLTIGHLRQQLALRAATIKDIVKLFPLWDPGNEASFDPFVAAMIALAQVRSQTSAAMASRYYQMFRAVELGRPAQLTPLAKPAPAEQIAASVAATTKAGTYRALRAGMTREQALRNSLVQVSGAVSRHVLNAGRETIIEAVQSDRQCQGWIRVSDGDPCAFCAMLLGRGPVYKEETAGFEAHDHCACGAEPVYEGSEWPAKNRESQNLYYEAQRVREDDESVLAVMRRISSTK